MVAVVVILRLRLLPQSVSMVMGSIRSQNTTARPVASLTLKTGFQTNTSTP